MSDWISVKERLPAIGLPVLVCHRKRKVEMGERVAGGYGWFKLLAGAYTREVSHWQPMPEPPGEEKQ